MDVDIKDPKQLICFISFRVRVKAICAPTADQLEGTGGRIPKAFPLRCTKSQGFVLWRAKHRKAASSLQVSAARQKHSTLLGLERAQRVEPVNAIRESDEQVGNVRSEIQTVWMLAFCLASPASTAEQPPKEIVQYIREARKVGVSDRQIQDSAVKAGWPAEAVTNAIEFMRTGTGARVAETPASPPVKPASARATATASVELASKTSPAINRGVPDEYQIGAGDVLQISVWKEGDASVPSVVVRPDGKISMPMLKEVHAAGLTPAQVEKVITEQLAKFISAADVTVIVKEINSKKIYVVGGVKKEGPIPYTYRMTILQALSEAGGLSDYAKKKKIYVLRHENGRDYQLPFDYDAALRGERMELNLPLRPGDTLVVPK
jgi:polysaccharide export outer membrane protein